MKIVIPGGSGQVGNSLAREFTKRGDQVVILGRSKPETPGGRGRSVLAQPPEELTRSDPGVRFAHPRPPELTLQTPRFVPWDARTLGEWTDEIDGADVVINLAGKTVNCRYNTVNRREIMNSRVDSTRVIGRAIAQCRNPPRVWLQASTATIYAHRFDAANDEFTGILGGSDQDSEPNAPDTWRFSIAVAKAWEAALAEVPTPRTRKVAMRAAMTMTPDRGGIFDVLSTLCRRGLGGTAGDGRQYVSWIHERDFLNAVHFLIEREELDGAVNLASPNPLPNCDFMRQLREALGVRIGLPATRWMLEVGAFFIRTETELILKSRRVVPGRLQRAGFEFQFPEWAAAARDIEQQHSANIVNAA